MTIVSKTKTLVEYAKLGVELVKHIRGKSFKLELPRPVDFLSTGWSTFPLKASDISSVYPVEISASYFKGDYILKTAIFPKTSKIPNNCFNNCTQLTEVDISGAITIEQYAFSNCKSLNKLVAPSAINVSPDIISSSGVTILQIPLLESLTYQFRGATLLTEAYLPGVCNISGEPFKDCTALKKVTFGKLERMSSVCLKSATLLEEFYTAKGISSSIYVHYCEDIKRECLEQIIDNYIDMTGRTAPVFQMGEKNIEKLSDEYIMKMYEKNIAFQ